MLNSIVSLYHDRIIKVGRDPQKVNPLSKAEIVSQIDQVRQDNIQSKYECPHGWKHHSLSEQPGRVKASPIIHTLCTPDS